MSALLSAPTALIDAGPAIFSPQGLAWSMPEQPRCNETSWVYLGSENNDIVGEEGPCGSDEEYSCLSLEFTITPFQVQYLAHDSKSRPAMTRGEEGRSIQALHSPVQSLDNNDAHDIVLAQNLRRVDDIFKFMTGGEG